MSSFSCGIHQLFLRILENQGQPAAYLNFIQTVCYSCPACRAAQARFDYENTLDFFGCFSRGTAEE